MLEILLILLSAFALMKLLRRKATKNAMRIEIAVLAALDRLGTASAQQIVTEINQYQKSLNEKKFWNSTIYAALGHLFTRGLITEVPNNTQKRGFRPTLWRLSDQGRRVKETQEKQIHDETSGFLPA